jgi:hypothetical protein
MIDFIVRIYLLRTPLLLFAILTGLAAFSNKAMISGLFALGAMNAIGVGVILGLAGGQIFILFRLYVCYSVLRFGGGQDPFPSKALWWSILLSAIPGFAAITAIVVAASSFGVGFSALAGFAIGSVGAAVIIGYGSSLRSVQDPGIAPGPATGAVRQPGRLDSAVIWIFGRAGFADSAGLLFIGHYLAFRLGVVSVVVFLMQYVLVWWSVPPPAAIYSLLIGLSIVGWAAGVACFALDHRRVPVFTVFAVWGVLLTAFLPYNSHYYYIQKSPAPVVLPKVSSLFPANEKRMIIVSAQGGGIWAAAWSTKVLSELTKTFGSDFACRVRLLSGISGGSTGLMLYSSLYQRPGGCRAADLKEAAGKVAGEGIRGDALDAAAQGLILGDLMRPVYPFLGHTRSDRGHSLETAWAQAMNRLGVSGADTAGMGTKFSQAVEAGDAPMLAFSATSVHTGWPVVFANFALQQELGVRVFHGLYPGYDVPLTTAVRASASFPYVSPSIRPMDCRPVDFKVCSTWSPLAPVASLTDGGLFDNYGVSTAYETLRQATSNFTQFGDTSVLWIQIRDKFQDLKPEESSSFFSSGFAGPVESLYSVRTSLQRKRVELVNEKARSHGVQVLEIGFPDVEPPLSWALTGTQKEAVRKGWEDQGGTATDAVRKFLGL